MSDKKIKLLTYIFLVISELLIFYLIFLQLPLGWDYPMYIKTLNGMVSIFSNDIVIRNSILFTPAYIIKSIFNLSSLFAFNLTIFLYLSLINILSLNIINSIINSFKVYIGYSPKHIKFIIPLSYIALNFYPYNLLLYNLYRQIALIFFFYLCIYLQLKFLNSNDYHNRVKILLITLYITSLTFLNLTSIMVIFSLIFLILISIEITQMSNKFYTQKNLFANLFLFSPFISFLFADIIAYNFFYTGNNPEAYFSSISYGVFNLIYTVNPIVRTYNLIIQYFLIYFIYTIIVSFIFLSYKYELFKFINLKKKLIDISIVVIFLFIYFNSIFFGDSSSQERGGFPFSLFFIWGGWIYLPFIFIKTQHISSKVSSSLHIIPFELTSKITILIYLVINYLIELIQILVFFGPGRTIFPIARVHMLLIYPLLFLSIINMLVLKKYYFQIKVIKSLIIGGIIGTYALASSLIVNNSLSLYLAYFSLKNLNSVFHLILLFFILIIILLKIPIEIEKIRKIIKQIFVPLFILCLISQSSIFLVTSISLPPTFEDHEYDFMENELYPNLPRNSNLALIPTQYIWVNLYYEDYWALFSITNISSYEYNAGYKDDNVDAVNLLIKFLENPNETNYQNIMNSFNNTYLWVTESERYRSFVNIDIEKITDFMTIVYYKNQNYLLYFTP